ncbi:MAG: transposase, partial [Burkholderiales bacterium]
STAWCCPRFNTQSRSIFLTEVAQRHRDEYILMLFDRDGWHQAARLVIPDSMRLIRLPPYSRERNPTEHLWDEIREKWLPNLLFDNLAAVEDRLVLALNTLEKDVTTLAATTGFNWIVIDPAQFIHEAA